MKDKFIRFMQGRYGVDQLSKSLLVSGIAFVILSSVLRIGVFGRVFYFLGLLSMIYCYARIFSKNHKKRYEENQKYLKATSSVRRLFHKQRSLFKQRRTHRIYTCPSCKQKVRIPKGKGKIEIRCPKCQTRFIKKS